MKPIKDSEVLAPLLPELRQDDERNISDNGASVSGAVFNVSTSIIGAGIMSIPATVKVLGVVPAFGLILIVAFLADVSVDFLLRYTKSGISVTYAGTMGESFGRVGTVLLQLCVMCTNLGCLIIYLIIIGDVMSESRSDDGTVHMGILQEWFGVYWWNTRAIALFFIVFFIMLPLVMLRRVESLRFTSAISVLLAVAFVAISSVLAISALCQGKTITPRLLPDLVHQTSFLELFTAVPVIVTAFTFHFNGNHQIRHVIKHENIIVLFDDMPSPLKAVHPIANELGKPSDMVSAVRISLVLSSVIYCAVGLVGYLLFGDSTMADILANFDQNFASKVGPILNDTVRLSYALHLILVFPLLNFSLRLNMDGLLFPNWPRLASNKTRFAWLTCVLLTLIYLTAIAIPNIWYFFQFIGSTAAVCIAFIFPGAIVLRDVHEISSRRDKILAILMILLAVVTSSIAILSNIASSI